MKWINLELETHTFIFATKHTNIQTHLSSSFSHNLLFDNHLKSKRRKKNKNVFTKYVQCTCTYCEENFKTAFMFITIIVQRSCSHIRFTVYVSAPVVLIALFVSQFWNINNFRFKWISILNIKIFLNLFAFVCLISMQIEPFIWCAAIVWNFIHIQSKIFSSFNIMQLLLLSMKTFDVIIFWNMYTELNCENIADVYKTFPMYGIYSNL